MLVRLFKWVQICACLLLFATVVSAQTVEPHISFGMKLSRSISPEVVDMSGAWGKSFGPAQGKVLNVFILAGSPVSEGRGLSRKLSVDMRRGSPRVLMFEDGLWQPLRPTGLRFGPEIGFGMRMSREFPGETIGIILPSPDGVEDLIGKASRALDIVACRAISLVQFSGSVPDYGAMADVVKARLGEPELFVLDMSAEESSLQGCYPSAMEIDLGDSLAQKFLEKWHAIIQE
jgi:hypothetical protein